MDIPVVGKFRPTLPSKPTEAIVGCVHTARKDRDNQQEKGACEAEREASTIIFPAIEIENEIEDIEDSTCIDVNRDEMLKSFCSFRSDLDNLFQIQNINKKAKAFWPNICCKERRDTTLEDKKKWIFAYRDGSIDRHAPKYWVQKATRSEAAHRSIFQRCLSMWPTHCRSPRKKR